MRNVLRAIQVATHYHRGQTRKFTGNPYIEHPLAVAELVGCFIDCQNVDSDDIIIAAIFHDILEDTEMTFDELRDQFGHNVASIVNQVTNHKFEEQIPRWEKFKVNLNKLKNSSQNAQIIKACDIIHNLSDIVEQDPKLALTYLTEKCKVAEVLKNYLLIYQLI